MNILRRIPLFKRLPKFHIVYSEEEIIPPAHRKHYLAFTDDFTLLDAELIPFFREFDRQALKNQNAYRWNSLVLIVSSALITIIGIVQIAFIDISWIGLVESAIALVAAIQTTVANRFQYQKRYLNARLAAERLRSEYFFFLGRFDPYTNEHDRLQRLRARVIDIKMEGEAL